MSDKERQIESLLSRREAMVWLGASGAVCLLGGKPVIAYSTPSANRSPCVVRPDQTEGPYFVDEGLHRSDIRSDPTSGQITPGTPLKLTFQVSRMLAGQCYPLPEAQLDVWHCNAMGVYSDVRDPGFSTVGQKFLRGYQVTDAQGIAQFLTVYPGWYPIRTVHIHFKIRTAPMARSGYEFISQLYFPDELTDRIHTALPYSSNGRRRVRNHQDFIFRDGGNRLMLEPSETHGGYVATFPIGLVIP